MNAPDSPYRNELAVLQQRREALEAELARLRSEAERLESVKSEEARLALELAHVTSSLDERRRKPSLPLLDQVRVASPCSAEWSEMVGDDRVRFCLSCEKNVYDLSAMTREAAEALLTERMGGGELCVRFYQRADGTILTQDCPEGAKKKRRKKLALAMAGAGAMMASAATAMFSSRQGDVELPRVVAGGLTMGEMAAPVTTTTPDGPVVESVESVTPPPVQPRMGGVAPPRGTSPETQEPARPTRGPVGRPTKTMGRPVPVDNRVMGLLLPATRDGAR